MTDIFREVDEELRQDQAKKLWQAYGRYAVAAAVALVLAVGGFQAWRAWDLQQRTEVSDRFARALALVFAPSQCRSRKKAAPGGTAS